MADHKQMTTRDLIMEAVSLRDERDQALAEVTKLKKDIEDWRASSSLVMSEGCPSDEKHCACVPYLRYELDGARGKIKRLESDLDKTGDLLAFANREAEKLRLRLSQL